MNADIAELEAESQQADAELSARLTTLEASESALELRVRELEASEGESMKRLDELDAEVRHKYFSTNSGIGIGADTSICIGIGIGANTSICIGIDIGADTSGIFFACECRVLYGVDNNLSCLRYHISKLSP